MAFSRGKTQVRLAAISLAALFMLDWCGSNGDVFSRSYNHFLTHTSNERKLLEAQQGGTITPPHRRPHDSTSGGHAHARTSGSRATLSHRRAKGRTTASSKPTAIEGGARALLRMNEQLPKGDSGASSRPTHERILEELGTTLSTGARRPPAQGLESRELREKMQASASRPLSSASGAARSPTQLAPNRAPPQALFGGGGIPELFAEHTELSQDAPGSAAGDASAAAFGDAVPGVMRSAGSITAAAPSSDAA